MNSSQHTIRKQIVQFQYNGNVDGFALQKEVSDWCNHSLIPEIEQQLDLFDLGDKYYIIDKLEIEASVNKNDWQQKIREELLFSLKQKLNNYIPKLKEVAGDKSVSKSGKLDELILYYFVNGYLPWWGKALITVDFETLLQNWINEEMSQSRADFISKRLQQTTSANLTERILNQVPQNLLFQLLKNIYKQDVDIIEHTESFYNEVITNNISDAKQKEITKAVYGFLLNMMFENEGTINTDLMVRFIYEEVKRHKAAANMLKPATGKIDRTANPVKNSWQQLLITEIKRKESEAKGHQQSVNEIESVKELNHEEKEIAENDKKEKNLQYNKLIDKLTNPDSAKKGKNELESELREGIFIDNAGAVIFAAFIPTLFKKLTIEKDGLIVIPDLAALIIQYCVTGNIKIAEYELVFPKILCGLDIEFPVNTNTEIDAHQMNEVYEMLQSLIEYWSVLKNTSVEGLRESFLKRSGKLSMINNDWLLQVEQKPFDMLLQHLPWSISMIKLPWMTHLLRTEWV